MASKVEEEKDQLRREAEELHVRGEEERQQKEEASRPRKRAISS